MWKERLRKHRRRLHRIPEIGDDLPRTKEYLLKVLSGLDCEIIPVMDSGLLAYFDGGKEETLAFRGDMDGLPIEEKTGRDYKSTHEGKMHACGHDGHMAMVLALAEYVNKKTLPYNILIVFQPAEETVGGASNIVDTGIFEKVNTKAVFGFHLWPFISKGEISTMPGPMMNMSSEVTGRVLGKTAHAGNAHEGIDALEVMVEFLADVYHMPKKGILRIGVVSGGTARNILADDVIFKGTLRALQVEDYEQMKMGVLQLRRKWEEQTGAKITFDLSRPYLPVINDPVLYSRMGPILDGEGVKLMDAPLAIAEDFSAYRRAAPSMFFLLGTGTGISLHSDYFDFDEGILERGFDFYKKIIEEYE